jgi:hypothetical protein
MSREVWSAQRKDWNVPDFALQVGLPDASSESRTRRDERDFLSISVCAGSLSTNPALAAAIFKFGDFQLEAVGIVTGVTSHLDFSAPTAAKGDR